MKDGRIAKIKTVREDTIKLPYHATGKERKGKL